MATDAHRNTDELGAWDLTTWGLSACIETLDLHCVTNTAVSNPYMHGSNASFFRYIMFSFLELIGLECDAAIWPLTTDEYILGSLSSYKKHYLNYIKLYQFGMIMWYIVANVTFDLIMSLISNYLVASPLYELNSFITINRQCMQL